MARLDRQNTTHPDAPWNEGMELEVFEFVDEENVWEYRIEIEGKDWRFWRRKVGRLSGTHSWERVKSSVGGSELIRMYRHFLLLFMRRLHEKNRISEAS